MTAPRYAIPPLALLLLACPGSPSEVVGDTSTSDPTGTTAGPVTSVDTTDTVDTTTTATTADTTADTTDTTSSPQTTSETTGCETDCDPSPWGLDRRPENPTCAPPPRLPTSSTAGSERAYDQVEWAGPTAGAFSPTLPERLYLAEKRGTLRWADPDSTEPTTALDIQGQVATALDMGMVGFAFDPEFAASGRIYVVYNADCALSTVCPPPGENPGLGEHISRISRFTSVDGGLTFPVESEEVILDLWQPVDNHTVDQVAFGPDGMLYVGSGDGNLQEDPWGLGQSLVSLRGKILRLDVSGVGPGYAVPPDNPFVGVQDAAPEVYALGLRNPWKLTFDRDTGELWAGDVGQYTYEEINRITAGGNFGWNEEEGPFCFPDGPPCDVPGMIDPVAWYDHGVGQAVVGGYVYRGSEVPALAGAYVFADYQVGKLWALWTDDEHVDLEPDVQGPFAEELLFEAGDAVVTMLEDADGELYYVTSVVYGDAPGRVYRLGPPSPPPPPEFPLQLSQTGCFEPDDPSIPTSGLIPYEPVAPFWSDGATKDRWLALPDGTWATVGSDGDVRFPVGTVLAKQFTLDDARLETRLFVRHDDGGWAGYTYRWRGDQSDADLVETAADVPVGDVVWHFPSRGECMFCHSEAAGRSLGPELRQLDWPMLYPSTGITANQVDTLVHIDVLRFTSDVARFGFDEGLGEMVMSGEYTGTFENGPTWTAEGLAFDGVDDLVRTDVPNGSVRTLAAWIRPETSDPVDFIESVIDTDVPGQYGSGFGLNNGEIVVILDDQFWFTGVPVTLGQWQHVALAFDGRQARLLVDGEPVGTLPYVQGDVTDANYVIGASNANALFFHGELRDVRIFDASLSDDDVARVRDGLDPEPAMSPGPYPDPYGDDPVPDRARAWLHTNCSQCHRPGGPGRGDFDMRYETPWADTGLCDAPPVGSSFGIADARIVAPGEPERSVLLYRIGATGSERMPPVSSDVADDDGVALIEAWIEGLDGCR
jgi:glucose/arabinose dehydrogenase/mono/diheme cytochrome c family protein